MSLSHKHTIAIAAAALILMGQSCSINFGNSQVADGGVFRSDDHGKNWVQKTFVRTEGKKTLTIRNLSIFTFAFDPEDSQTIFLGSRDQGIWKSDNRGDQWAATSLRSGSYRCITFDPDNSEVMYTASGSTILKSTDAGETWSVVYNESQPGHLVRCVIVDPFVGNLVWAVTNGGKVLLSEDFGATWTLVQNVPPVEPERLFVPPDGTGQLYIFSQNQGIYHLTGRGAAMEDLSDALSTFPQGQDIRAVTIVGWPESQWYLGTGYGLLTSSDYGRSWTAIPTLVNPTSIGVDNVAVNVTTPLEIFVTIGNQLHRTTDNGQTWETSVLPTGRILNELTFDPEDSDRMYISTIEPVKK